MWLISSRAPGSNKRLKKCSVFQNQEILEIISCVSFADAIEGVFMCSAQWVITVGRGVGTKIFQWSKLNCRSVQTKSDTLTLARLVFHITLCKLMTRNTLSQPDSEFAYKMSELIIDISWSSIQWARFWENFPGVFSNISTRVKKSSLLFSKDWQRKFKHFQIDSARKIIYEMFPISFPHLPFFLARIRWKSFASWFNATKCITKPETVWFLCSTNKWLIWSKYNQKPVTFYNRRYWWWRVSNDCMQKCW